MRTVRFETKALDRNHAVCVSVLEALDEADARRQLVEQGVRVISVGRRWQPRLSSPRRIPLAVFSQELVALLDAGLTLVDAIETLTEKEHQHGTRRSLEQIRDRLLEGKTLSAALEDLPAGFPPLYVATVRASERTGAIREALVRYVIYQQAIDGLRKKLVAASIYPAVLCVAGLLVAGFLLGYVVPRFSGIYEDLGSELPLASRLLMQWGEALAHHGGATAGVLLAAFVAAAYAATRPGVGVALAAAVTRIPAFGRQMRTYQLARLYRTVGMLLRGGTPAVTALHMSAGLLDPSLRQRLAQATGAVREGRSLADSLEGYGLTTPVSARMLRVGERTGNMGEMMERIASFYDDEIERSVDLLSRLLEPALMTVIGLVIGAIVVLMYFPIFELAGSIQ